MSRFITVCAVVGNAVVTAQVGDAVRLVASRLVGSAWWSVCETARGSVMIRAAMVAVGVTLGMTDPGGVLRGLVHPPLPERPGTGAAGPIEEPDHPRQAGVSRHSPAVR